MSVTVAAGGETLGLSDPLVAAVLHDFSVGGLVAAWLPGSLSDKAWLLAPGSSTGAAVANALPAGTVNSYYVLRTAKAAAGLALSRIVLLGTPQGHDYGGLMLDHCDRAAVSDALLVAIPGSAASPPGETFAVNVYGGVGVTLSRVEVDGRGVGASGIGVNGATTVELVDCYVHDCPHGMPTFWQTAGVTTRRLRSVNNHLGVNHERVSGPVRHDELQLHVAAAPGQMHLTLNNDLADNPDVEIHLAAWSGGHYGPAGPLCVMIGDRYRGAVQQQTTLPRIYGPTGALLQWADAGSATARSVNVAAATASPAAFAVRFH